WNLRDDSVPWMGPMNDLLRRPGDVVSESRNAANDEITGHPSFTDVKRAEFANPLPYDTEQLVLWVRSTSRIAVPPEDERPQVLADVRRLTETHPDLRGHDTFEMPLITVCVRGRVVKPS